MSTPPPPKPIIAGDDWATARWGAETLAIFYLITMMQIAMKHTISEGELETLLQVGASMFCLLGKFGVGRHRLRSLGLSEFVLCYFMAWNARDVFQRFMFASFGGLATGLSLGLGILGSVQSGERHHGLTKMRMRFSPHDRYRWHRHGVSEDVRVFAGNRFNPEPSYYDNWLAGLDHKRSILGPATDGGCTGCGRSVCVECPYVCMTPHVAKEDEHNIRLVPPLCRWCWLRLLIHRQGVGTPAQRGFVGIVKEWHAKANAQHHALLAGATEDEQRDARVADGTLGDDRDVDPDDGDSDETALVDAAATALASAVSPEDENAALAAAAAPDYDSDDDIGMMGFRF